MSILNSLGYPNHYEVELVIMKMERAGESKIRLCLNCKLYLKTECIKSTLKETKEDKIIELEVKKPIERTK